MIKDAIKITLNYNRRYIVIGKHLQNNVFSSILSFKI